MKRSIRIPRSALPALALLLLAGHLGPARAECTAAAGVPPGSYRQSCTNCVASGGDLTASCRKIRNSYNQENTSTLRGYAGCRSDISNFDGRLTCDKGDAALPEGSYRQSCRDLNRLRDTLYASCRTVGGQWKETSLPLGNCIHSVYNSDGNLACMLPYGSYQHSCRGVRVDGGRLLAECRTRSGAWSGTAIGLPCSRDLANIDGVLRCQ